MSIIVYTGGIGRCLEEKCIGELRRRAIEIQEHRRIFGRHQKRIWRRR